MKKLRLSKNLLSSLFLLVVALVICVPLWLHGTIWGHDLGFHLYRFAGLENAIRGGQIVPQVDSELLYGAGYGFSLFYGPLAAYMALLGKIISGGSWIWGVNLMIFGCVYGGGLAMAKMVNEISKKRYLGLMVAMVYMLAPYHLTDIYVRSAFGELPTFFLAPMLWLGLWRLIEKKEKYLLWTVLGMAGMLLSHNLSVFIFGLIAGGYLLINIKKLLYIKVINRLLLSAVVALGVSAFFWVPFGELKMASNYNIWQKNYQEVIMAQNGDFFNFGALTLRRLFWDDKVTGGASNVMAFGIGLAAMAGLVGFWPLSKKMEKEERDLGRAMWILGVGSMLLTTNLIPWERMPSVFYMMQFPWRMLLAGGFCLSIVAGRGVFFFLWFVPRPKGGGEGYTELLRITLPSCDLES
ncbi:6-pyruvoyl-tetrahydropterin synthase-related protein [Microgenomates group bacterium]|nr:6-pyruvoyl-tetrahydropterin synthase-related protein [Microgenomates group bacterium]